MPDYTAQNRQSAAIILADPRRYLGWPADRTDAEVEATAMVQWARQIAGESKAKEEFELS